MYDLLYIVNLFLVCAWCYSPGILMELRRFGPCPCLFLMCCESPKGVSDAQRQQDKSCTFLFNLFFLKKETNQRQNVTASPCQSVISSPPAFELWSIWAVFHKERTSSELWNSFQFWEDLYQTERNQFRVGEEEGRILRCLPATGMSKVTLCFGNVL